jgi:hypothetical protein
MFGDLLGSFNKSNRNMINEICFNDKMVINLANIFFLCCFWMDSWAIIQKEKQKNMLEAGSNLIRRLAKEFC